MKFPKIKGWEFAFADRHVMRYVFAGNYDKGRYQGKKIADKNAKARRRRQIERGHLTPHNGLER